MSAEYTEAKDRLLMALARNWPMGQPWPNEEARAVLAEAAGDARLVESADVYAKRHQPGGDLYRACSGPDQPKERSAHSVLTELDEHVCAYLNGSAILVPTTIASLTAEALALIRKERERVERAIRMCREHTHACSDTLAKHVTAILTGEGGAT